MSARACSRCGARMRAPKALYTAYDDSLLSSSPLTPSLPLPLPLPLLLPLAPSRFLSLPLSLSPPLFLCLGFPPLSLSLSVATLLSLCSSLPFYLPPSRTPSLPTFLPPSLRVPLSEFHPFTLVSPGRLPHSIAAAHTQALRSSPPPACPCVPSRDVKVQWIRDGRKLRQEAVLPKTTRGLSNQNRMITIILRLDYLT